MKSRSRTVSRRRRTLPASDTAMAAACAESCSTMSWTAGSARPSRPRSSLGAFRPAPAARAARIFSSLFCPMPERPRSRPSSAAVFSPSSVVTPSSVQIRAAVFGPTPGRRRKSTTPAGTFSRRRVSACISPSVAISTTFCSIVLPIPGRSVALPASASSATGPGVSRMRVAARRYAMTLNDSSAEDLRDVREEVELVGDLGVPGQSLRHAAMIRTCSAGEPVVPPRTPSFNGRPSTHLDEQASSRRLPAHLQRAREPGGDGDCPR